MARLARFTNNATSRLAANLSAAGLTLTVTPGDGAKFPTLSAGQYFTATLVKANGTKEIVKVTARATDTFTIVRAYEAAAGVQTAFSFSAGDKIELRMTAGALGNELDRLDLAALTRAVTKSANYTVVEGDISTLIRVDTSGGVRTITLPLISTLTDAFEIVVTKITSDVNLVNVTPSGGDTINGGSTYSLSSSFQSAWVIADRTTNTWTAINSGAGGSAPVIDAFVGNGTAGAFGLSGDPVTKNNTAVYVGGVYQQKSTYTLVGTALTLGGVVPVGVPIEVVWVRPVALGSTTDDLIVTAPAPGSLWTTVRGFIAWMYARYTELIGQFGSSLIGFVQSGTGAVTRSVQDKLRDEVHARDFNVKADGATDDSAALAAAHAAATAAGVPLVLPAGVMMVGTSSFSIDVSKTEWVNPGGAALQWTGAPSAGYGVRLVGTSDYNTTWKSARVMRLPALLGGTQASPFAGDGLRIGDGAIYTHQIDAHCAVQGFANSVSYQHNAWRITLRGRFMWGNITTPGSPVNFGECMAFQDAFIADGATVTLNDGDWHFRGGSLDNTLLVINGSTQVVLDATHIENPGSSTNAPLMIDVAGTEAICRVNDGHLVINNPGGPGITDAPFRVSSSNTTAGLEIDGLQYSQQSFFASTTNDDYMTLVRSGSGRCVVRDVSPRAFSNFLFMLPAGTGGNKLTNGGFESASLSPWVTTGTGTAALDSTQKITGKRITSNKSAKLTVAAATNYVQIAYTASCTAQQMASFQVWAKGDGIAGHDGQVKLDFLDYQGNSIAGSFVSSAVSSTGSAWALYRLAAFAPPGAHAMFITLNCSRASADGSVWYDEAVMNLS